MARGEAEVTIRSNDPCWCGSGRKFKRCHRAPGETVRPGATSPRRQVPVGIERPDYAEDGRPKRTREPFVKDAATIERMRRAGRVAPAVLETTGTAVAPGVTTDELDAVAHEACASFGAYPSPLDYRGFPKSICTSVNEVICHGIPDDRPLTEDDIVNADFTVFLEGVHGDNNATFGVGALDPVSARLLEVTRGCLALGIDAAAADHPVSDIGRAVQRQAEASGFSVVRSFAGHGIGTVFHNGLSIPHFFDPAADTLVEEGMTFTIEPMINAGAFGARLWDDGWTAAMPDGARSAQFEHTLVVVGGKPEVLTGGEGGHAPG